MIFLSILIMITLGLFSIGPVFHSLENVILTSTKAILDLPFGLAGIIIGGLQQVVVITGVHHIFNLLEIQLLADTKFNPFNPLITSAIVAQGAATLAVGLKSKNKKVKALAFPSAFSAFLGMTEPAILGVNLRFFKPFIMGLIGGAVGGFLASIFHLKATGMSVTAIPGLLLYLNNHIFVNLIALAVSFILTWLFGYNDKMLKNR